MNRTRILVFVATAALSSCATETPEQQILSDAASALGGRDIIESTASLTIEGEGSMGNLGQDMTPDATSQHFAVTDYRRTVDLNQARARTEQTRTPDFNYFRGPGPMTQSFGIDGDVAYSMAPDGSASRAPEASSRSQRIAYYHHPLTLVRAALAPDAAVTNARVEGPERLVDITTADGNTLTLAIEDGSGLPSRITSLDHHPNLRDVTRTTRFSSYEDVDGLTLPTRLVRSIDDFEELVLEVSMQSLGADTGDLTAPESATSAAPITGPPPANVTAEPVADGVWFLAGESHHSVLVEMSDHVVLIEAPNEVRTLAVVEKARAVVPDKPLTHLVNTHHHFDHSGGVRAAISEGLTIVTHESNAAFYEELGARPSTIEADALARNPQDVSVVSVGDELTLGDDSMRLVLYPIDGNPHGSAILMAYLPDHRLLVQADAFSPGRNYQPFAANLLSNVETRELLVERIVPIHGGITPFEGLVDAVKAMTN